MKYSIALSILLTFIATSTMAGSDKLDLSALCKGSLGQSSGQLTKNLMIVDNGFCDVYLQREAQDILTDSIAKLDNKNDCSLPVIKQEDKWKIRFYASHSFTTYFNSDISFRSSRYSVDIKDYEWAERGSRDFFQSKTWKKDGNNPLQMIDEPSNTFTISIEKNNHEFFLSAFHPKFLQARDQKKYMKGTIAGVDVDGVQYVDEPYDGYNQRPGESELARNQNTHLQMTFEVGYGYRMKLLNTKIGSISYIPSVGLGVMAGKNLSIMVKENEWWEYNEASDQLGIQGVGGSITNRIELNTPKERFGLFYENKLAFYRQKHGFMDGTQSYNLGFMGNSVGMKFMLYNPQNHKNKN